MDNNQYLNVIVNRKKRVIPIESVHYVESKGRKIILHCRFGDIIFYSKMSEIENILIENGFIRIHQSFMVRIEEIKSLSRFWVEIGSSEIPVSRRYYNNIKMKLMEKDV